MGIHTAPLLGLGCLAVVLSRRPSPLHCVFVYTCLASLLLHGPRLLVDKVYTAFEADQLDVVMGGNLVAGDGDTLPSPSAADLDWVCKGSKHTCLTGGCECS